MTGPNLPPGRVALLLATLMLTQTIGWGTSVSLIGVLAEPIRVSLGMGSGMVYAGITLTFLIGAVVAPLAGRVADRIGGLRALVIGTPILALALLTLGLATAPVSYFAAWALFGLGMHFGLATAAYNALVQVLGVGAHRGIAVLTLATGLSSSVFWPISEAALGIMDWRRLCIVYAVLTIVVCFPAHVWLARTFGVPRGSPAGMEEDESPAHIAPEAAGRAFLLLAGMQTITAAIGTAVALLIIDLFVALGTPREQAVLAASLLGVAYLLSRGLDVALGAHVSRMALARWVYLAFPLSLVPLLVCAMLGIPLPFWLAAATAVAYGMPAGLLGILRPALPFHIFGSNNYGRRLGRLARPMDIANAMAPAGFAWVISSSPQALLWLIIGLGGVAFATLIALGTLVSDGPGHRHYASPPV